MFSVPVIHDDARILAVNKPAGALVIPGRLAARRGPGLPGRRALAPVSRKGSDGKAEESLVEKLSGELGKKLFVVHRLDRDASGLLVFAKDAATHRALSLAFERRDVKKTYLALVQGTVESDGLVDKPIHEFGSGRMGVDPRGKPSVTRYRVKEQLTGVTLLEVIPESGRRHQIRVHLYSLGHPIIGDRLYGKPSEPKAGKRLMLHAWRLTLPNPDGGALELAAEPGRDFREEMLTFS